MQTTAPAPVRRESTDDRRRAIAAAARALIVEKGFEGLRTRDIADRVGINIATLHYHVPSKQALIELVCQSLIEDFVAQYQRRPRAGLDAAERLRAELADDEETMFERHDVAVVLAEFGARARRDPVMAEVLRRMRAEWRNHYRDILRDGVDAGIFRPDLDLDAASLMIIATMVGLHSHAGLTRQGFAGVVEEIVAAVTRGGAENSGRKNEKARPAPRSGRRAGEGTRTRKPPRRKQKHD